MDLQTLFPWLIGAAAVATFAVLAAGVVSMFRKNQNPKQSNILMRWRVGLQGLAVLLLILFMILMGKG